jgi:membrane associated rhomboid family serine protease
MNDPYQRPQTTDYRPPPRRRLPRTPAVSVIIGINVLVFLAWQAASVMPPLQNFMVANFLVSTTHLAHGLVWTLLTAAFSHSEIWHLAINMFVLWSFGTMLERLWGTRTFVIFYLVAAVVASISHCLVSTVLMGNSDIQALGASGAISGLLLAYALLFPHHKILLMGIIPVPALMGVLAFVGIDLWGLFAQTRGGGLPIGHGAHLGGALAGALMYFFWLRSTLPAEPEPSRQSPRSAPLLSADEAHEFERIRIKIEAYGPQALNPKEKYFLDQLRERVLRDGGQDQ